MLAGDPLDRVLIIDLTKRRAKVVHRPDLIERALGGVGVATRLLQEECPNGADPLGPENPIILAVGPLSGLFPMASKTIAMFKSPHTGNLGESHAGGRSAVAIRMAGYGAIVIRGARSSPVYLVIEGDKVHFRDARAMWGMHSSVRAGSIIREREAGAGMRTIMRIGPAGEKCVSYASVITETYRHFGRLGLGAVFGSKRLKGIVVSGVRSLPVSRPTALPQDATTRSSRRTPNRRCSRSTTSWAPRSTSCRSTRWARCPRAICSPATSRRADASPANAWPKSTWAAGWPAPTARWRASTSRRCASRTPRSRTSTRRT